MKWRLREGQGEAIYEIGVEDSGLLTGLEPAEMTASLTTLHRMAAELGAAVTVLRERRVSGPDGEQRCVSEVLVRKVSPPGRLAGIGEEEGEVVVGGGC